MVTHPNIKIVDPRQVAHMVSRPLRLDQFAEAFLVLVDKGYLQQIFKAESPQGSLEGPDFQSVDEVPEFLRDRYDVPFEVSRVVPVFRRNLNG